MSSPIPTAPAWLRRKQDLSMYDLATLSQLDLSNRNLSKAKRSRPEMKIGKSWKRGVGLCMMASAGPGWAELPLMVEDLLIEEKTVQLNFGVTYSNQGYSNFALYSRDQAISRLGVRYGVTTDTEVYGRITSSCSETRTLGFDGEDGEDGEATSTNTCRWRNFVGGVNHRFSPENATPALLGHLEK